MAEYANRREFTIPAEIKDLCKLNKEKYVKKHKDAAGGKKEALQDFYNYLIDDLPFGIEWIVRYGHIPDAAEAKEKILNHLKDEKLIKKLDKKFRKDGNEGYELLPIVIFEILETEATKFKEAKTDNETAELPGYVNKLLELSHMSMKKKIKKLTSNGVDANLAFDVLSVIPTSKAISSNKYKGLFRFRKLMQVIYRDASTLEDVKFDKIAKYVVKSDFYPALITALLLERNEIKADFNDNQIKCFNSITTWCFNTMEDFDKDTIKDILTVYIKERKKDASNNRDSNRRFFISSLPATEYKEIHKVMEKMLEVDPSIKEYL